MASVTDKYIFIHIYKTGGLSVRFALQKDPHALKEVQGGHSNAIDCKTLFEKNGWHRQWNDRFKFAFVRNPYTWNVSTYLYIKTSPGHGFHKLMKDKSFDYFMEWLISEAFYFNKPFGSNHYQTQTEFLTSGLDKKILVDFVGRFETLEKDLRFVANKLNIRLPAELPHKNKTPRQAVEYMRYYDKHTTALVNEYFEDDFKLFNYKMI